MSFPVLVSNIVLVPTLATTTTATQATATLRAHVLFLFADLFNSFMPFLCQNHMRCHHPPPLLLHNNNNNSSSRTVLRSRFLQNPHWLVHFTL
jgi:hypothetical protein